MECLHGNGTKPVHLLTTWQQALHRQAAGGDGGGGGWSSPGPADDNTPGPFVDRESEDNTLTASVTSPFVVLHMTSCLLWKVPSFLLSQVRQMNQASNQKQFDLTKAKRRLLRRKNDRNQVSLVTRWDKSTRWDRLTR